MTVSHVSVLAWITLVGTVFRYTTALPFDEPPMPLQPVSRGAVEKAKNRGFMWVPRTRNQPYLRGRYEGGYDLTSNGPLGVCRMRYEGGVHPGKVFDGKCNIGYGHKEIVGAEYEVLVARRDAFWHMAPKSGADLKEALTGGHEANGHPLKLCVARHRTGWGSFSNYHGYHPGKYVWGRCNFGFADQEISSDDFFLVALGSKLETKTGAMAVNRARATPRVDSGSMTRDAESALGFADAADAGDVDAAAVSDVDAAQPDSDAQKSGENGAAATTWSAVASKPEPSDGSARPISCLQGEVTCHCDKLSGCTLPGYCPCSP